MTSYQYLNTAQPSAKKTGLVKSLRTTGKKLGLRRGYEILTRRKPLRSEIVAFGLRRDLSVPFSAPTAKIPLQVRPLDPRDYPKLFDTSDPSLDADELALLKARLELALEGIGQGFVAVTSEDDPCYVQWLFGPADNDAMQRYFDGLFPTLRIGEALLEGAFTPVHHRGKGIMSSAMAQIAEQATQQNARFVITFVTNDNIASLKGCERAGFTPYIRRRDKWIGIRRTIRFEALA